MNISEALSHDYYKLDDCLCNGETTLICFDPVLLLLLFLVLSLF